MTVTSSRLLEKSACSRRSLTLNSFGFFQVIRKAGNTLPQETLIGLEVDSEMEKEF